jgi:hypothetical protein
MRICCVITWQIVMAPENDRASIAIDVESDQKRHRRDTERRRRDQAGYGPDTADIGRS